jgi:hypothetical protein
MLTQKITQKRYACLQLSIQRTEKWKLYEKYQFFVRTSHFYGKKIELSFLWNMGCTGSPVRLQAGRPEFESRHGQRDFLFATAYRSSLGPTEVPIQWVPGVLSPRVKRPVPKADHSPPFSAEIKNVWSCLHSHIHLHGVCLVKDKVNFVIPY